MDDLLKAGGPAFPSSSDLGEGITSSFMGMTLRDYFAGQVLPEVYRHAEEGTEYDDLAHEAYNMADAMIAARAER